MASHVLFVDVSEILLCLTFGMTWLGSARLLDATRRLIGAGSPGQTVGTAPFVRAGEVRALLVAATPRHAPPNART